MEIISINDLNYEKIIQDLYLTITDNSFITISGPNNSGKTTLIRILNREIIIDNQVSINSKGINDYKINEYETLLQSVIPLEIKFQEKKVSEELFLYSDNFKNQDEIIKPLKIKRIVNKQIENLNIKEIIKLQLAIALLNKPKIVLIDSLSPYFEEEELSEIIKFLKNYQEKNNITIIYFTINLKECLLSDYLYIISNGCIALEGKPLEVLEKDNILNKIGLDLPFMIDLSVKLKDYDLIKEIELDIDRMVEELWN